MTDFQLQAAFFGNLEGFQEGVIKACAEAAHETMETVRERGVARLRASLKQAGLDAIANTWRGEIYPGRGRKSVNPALLIWSKAPEIINANRGELIRSPRGAWLAIPIPGSPAEEFPNPRGPATKVDYARQKFGDRLFLIPAAKGRPAMLAVEGAAITKTGRVSLRKQTKTGKWGQGTMTIFLFWLVPDVQMPPRLDPDADFRWIEQMFEAEYPRLLGDALVRAGLGA